MAADEGADRSESRTMDSLETINFTLPAGWSSECYSQANDQVVLTRPGPHGGMVTVDFKRRIFATGMGSPRFCAIEGAVYRGREWRSRIVADAIAHLDDVMR
jgi:hypothetical protein